MHAPFVLAAQPCGRAVDHDFALAQAEGAFVEKAAGEHLFKDARAPCHGAEQDQWLEALGHDAREFGGDLG